MPAIWVWVSSAYLMSAIWTFDNIENKHDIYRDEDYMKRFCESLWEHKNENNKL